MMKMLPLRKKNLISPFVSVLFANVRRGFDEQSFWMVRHLLDRKKHETN